MEIARTGKAAGLALAVLLSAPLMADELVLSIENSLQALGYAIAAPDGRLDTKTELAITKFQLANHLEATGQPSVKLAALLEIQAEQGGAPAAIQPAVPAVASAPCVPRSADHTVTTTQRMAGGVSKLFNAATTLGGRFGNSAEASKVGGDVAAVASSTSTAVSGAHDVGAIPEQDCP
jgi:peptidoglycan hydrolase-like protein with peptidoglycan-binding domain